MSEEEVECVAEELAKVGGVAWYPGREPNAILRVVSDRYRDRARVAIAALERLRASRQQTGTTQLQTSEKSGFCWYRAIAVGRGNRGRKHRDLPPPR